MYEGGCYVFRNDQNSLYNQLFSEACPIIDEKLVGAIFITHLKELIWPKKTNTYIHTVNRSLYG